MPPQIGRTRLGRRTARPVHRLRHYFITSLERSGISPKMAQTLARHSDIRLTLGVYTHVGLHDQTAAIGALPGPTTAAGKPDRRQQVG